MATVHKSALAAALVMASAGVGARTEPNRIESRDPLQSAAPRLEGTLQFREISDRGGERLIGSLRAQGASGSMNRIDVVVLLRLPVGIERPDGTLEPLPRARAVGAVERAFVDDATAWGFTVRRGLSHFPIVFGSITSANLARIADLREVRSVEPTFQLEAMRQEGSALVNADFVRDILGGTGQGVGVAVIDSGTDDSHSELFGKVVAQADYTGTVGDGTIDESGHGTAVAGIIAGEDAGLAPRSHLWALKVLADGSGDFEWVLQALNDVFAFRHEFGGVQLVNMSLGGPPASGFCDAQSPAFAEIGTQLITEGILLIAASGNHAATDGISLPACLTSTIAVGAVYDDDIGYAVFANCIDWTTAPDRITCYSDSGPALDVLAPSHCTSTPDRAGGYSSCFGGTSAAAPYVAGVLAQVRSLRPDADALDLTAALFTTGTFLSDPRNGIIRPRVDAFDLLISLPAPSAQPIFSDGFESGDTNAWRSQRAMDSYMQQGRSDSSHAAALQRTSRASSMLRPRRAL